MSNPYRYHRKNPKLCHGIVLALLLALTMQILQPVAVYARPSTVLPAGILLEAPPSASEAVVFRTRLHVKTPAHRLRLAEMEITVLEQGPDWALVLADAAQLEDLARLGFAPQASDELTGLVSANAQAQDTPWLQTSLQPLFAQSQSVQQQLQAQGETSAPAVDFAELRSALRSLSPEQLAGIGNLTSLDDDVDGLTNTQEAWWCTDPLNADTDLDGRTDGQEIDALKAWLRNESNGPPVETPWPSWPFGNPACPDKDYDAVPNLAERWDLGLNMDLESTDRDRYDDGQELFGVTYCPGGGNACGYGTLPSANHDGIVLFPQMPSFVSAPGNHPLVAAFPLLDVSVQADSIHVERVTTITTSEGSMTQESHTYETSVMQGQSTGTSESVNWNNWEEVSEAVDFPVDALRLTLYEAREPIEVTADIGKILGGTVMYVAGHTTECAAGAVAGGVGGSIVPGLGTVAGTVLGCAIGFAGGVVSDFGWDTIQDGFSDDPDAAPPDLYQVNDSYNTYTTEIKPHIGDVNNSLVHDLEANYSMTVNQNFDSQGVMNAVEGVSHAINQQGDLMARGFYDVTQGLGDISRGLGDISDGLGNIYTGLGDISDNLGEMTSALGDISYQISRPRATESHTTGYSQGGEQSTTHQEFEEHAVTQGEIFATAENWSTAWAVDSSRAALLSFTYDVGNTGADYAREISNLSFNIFIGGSPYPVTTYYVAPDLGGDGMFHNFRPGEHHSFTQGANQSIALTLEQMKAIDLGEPIRIVVEDYVLGQDDFYADDALNKGVLVAIEDGVTDGDESVDRYVIPTWGTDDSVQDVLLRYFPAHTDGEGNITSLWTPEFSQSGPPTWHEHFLSEISWWSVYLSQPDAGNTPLHELPAQPGSTLLFRFGRDSDRDGYNDRTEMHYGTDKDDPNFHPKPELLAGYVAQQSGNDVTALLKLANTGTFNAYNISAVMYAPDDTTTVLNNTIGGNGVVLVGRQIAVGSLIRPPNLSTWGSDSAEPYASGNYTGNTDRTYTFSVQTGGVVGAGATTVSWNDGVGGSGVLNIGSGYHAPLPLSVADGLMIGFDSGESIVAGRQFTVRTLTPRDTFKYRITPGHETDYTEPVIVVSYSSPRGVYRFATPVRLTSLGDDLLGATGQMLKGVRLEVIATPFDPEGPNTVHYIINNPHPETIHDAHLYVNVVGGGSVAKEYPITLDVPQGPTVYSLEWSTADFTVAYDPAIDYVLMAFWTDRYGNIIDSISRPLSSFVDDRVMEAAVPEVAWNVGTVYASTAFASSNYLLGTSFTNGTHKQSTSYGMVGSAGQVTHGTAMTSSNYGLTSGFWATIAARRSQPGLLTQGTGTVHAVTNNAIARYPTHQFAVANIGPLPLQIGLGNPPSGATIDPEPHAMIGSGAFTELGVLLNTDGLPLGAFEKAVPLITNDPNHPSINLRLTGTVEPNADVVFVYDHQQEIKPLTKIAHVNSTRAANDVVRLTHDIPGNASVIHPLKLYAGDESTLLGLGAELNASTPRLWQTNGDAASTDLKLTDATSGRRDYVLQYGLKASLSAGGQATYQVPLPKRAYVDVTLQILAREVSGGSINLSLDVGNDGSIDWQYSGPTAESFDVSSSAFTQAANAYLQGQIGTEVLLPIKLTSSMQGTFYLTDLHGAPSTDFDLRIPGDLVFDIASPKETDVVQVCAGVVNDGLGDVSAAVVSFYVHDPAVAANVLIGHAVLKDLQAQGGQAQACTSWDTTGYTGDVTVHAYVDFLNQVPENNENNNTHGTPIGIRTRPDLLVPAIQLSNAEPVAGEAVSIHVPVHNDGQSDAGSAVVALYDGNPDDGGVLIAENSVAVASQSNAPLVFSWTPAGTGQHRLFVIADRDRAVNETNEVNNLTWLDVYAGFASAIVLDSGNATADPPYSATTGFGVVDETPPDVVVTCGSGIEPEDTLRQDPNGRVVYRFDHLLPGHFYHLDVTLHECDGNARQETVSVDGNRIAGPVDLGDSQSHFLSQLLDPALYADHAISVTVEAEGFDGALVSEVNLYDVDYRYADAGGGQDPQYPGARLYGWLDGVSSLTGGALPYQSVRVNQTGNLLRYRFDGLQTSKRYAVNLTFYQSSGAGRQQRVEIDGQATGLVVSTGDYIVHRERVFVPGPAYTSDGSIVVGIVRTNASTGAMVNEISLEELTVRSPDIALSPTGVAASQAQGVLGSQPLSIDNTGTANLNWAITEAPSDCAAPGDVAWLGVSPTSGTTAAGSSTALAVSLDARSLSPGSYPAKLCISSNDPDQPLLSVPVALTVTPATNVPRLAIPSNVPGNPYQTVAMPVQFTRNGTNIAVVTFSVDYDQTCLQFDPADADSDGVPDAVTFGVSGAFQVSVTFDAADTDGELDFFIGDTFPPLSALPDGTPATIQFRVICQSPPGNPILARVGFSTDPPTSFGATNGTSVPGVTSDGSVEIQSVRAGDCNADTRVDAGDISAVVLEIFDGDGTNPSGAGGGTFPGSPVGCNANEDATIDAGDISCTVLTIFNGPGACGGMLSLEALDTSGRPPALSLLEAKVDGERMTVPIVFTPGDHQISSLAFAIDYDPAVAGIDPTDADGNGIPDAVVLSLPLEFAAGVIVNQQTGRLQIMIADVAAPLAALPEQMIALVTWQVKNGESASAGISLSIAIPASFGNTSGQSVSTSDFVKRE